MTFVVLAVLTVTLGVLGCAKTEQTDDAPGLTADEIENIVRRSYQYVAMYNVISKNAMHYGSLTNTSGWNVSPTTTQLTWLP